MTDIPQKSLNARFEVWFQEEMPRLYRYLCYQTRDAAAAEEITARACEKALTRVAQYDPSRGDLRVWMFGIARNELRGWFRSTRRGALEISLDNLPEFTFLEASPEQELARKEAFAAVMRAVTALPEREQEAVALRYGAGLPAGQIAAILGLTETNAGVVLHRALEKLKKSMEEVSYENR